MGDFNQKRSFIDRCESLQTPADRNTQNSSTPAQSASNVVNNNQTAAVENKTTTSFVASSKKTFDVDSFKKKILSNTKKVIAVAVLLALIVLVFILNIIKDDNVQISSSVPVYVQMPHKSNLENYYSVPGYIESAQMLTILPKISGAISKIYVDVEDYVEKGQVVAEIDSSPFDLTLQQAQAAYKALKSTYDRITTLYNSGGASLQQYEEARAKFDATKAQYELAKLQVSYCKIRSEISGRVLVKHDNIAVGILVAPTIPIFTIGQPDKLVIKAKIPEGKFELFSSQRKSVNVKIEIPSYQQELDGYIDRISPYIEPASKAFSIYCKPRDSKVMLPPGLSIKIKFILDSKEDVLVVSRKALIGDDIVWVATKKEVAPTKKDKNPKPLYFAKKYTFTPPFETSEYIMVNSQFEDSFIIVDGNEYLYDGQEVIIKNKKDYAEFFSEEEAQDN